MQYWGMCEGELVSVSVSESKGARMGFGADAKGTEIANLQLVEKMPEE